MPRAGEIWPADIPFTNGAASKLRPVLVLWEDGADVVVAAVTSAPPRTATDVPVRDWANAGLRVASTIRLSRLDRLEQTLLRHCLGVLPQADAAQVRTTWRNEVRLRF
jgi:mRNA interferase MazF